MRKKQKKPSYIPNQGENKQQTTFKTKKVEPFGLFLCVKSKKPSYMSNQAENEKQKWGRKNCQWKKRSEKVFLILLDHRDINVKYLIILLMT